MGGTVRDFAVCRNREFAGPVKLNVMARECGPPSWVLYDFEKIHAEARSSALLPHLRVILSKERGMYHLGGPHSRAMKSLFVIPTGRNLF